MPFNYENTFDFDFSQLMEAAGKKIGLQGHIAGISPRPDQPLIYAPGTIHHDGNTFGVIELNRS